MYSKTDQNLNVFFNLMSDMENLRVCCLMLRFCVLNIFSSNQSICEMTKDLHDILKKLQILDTSIMWTLKLQKNTFSDQSAFLC
jgi:hypothetical protein